MEVFFCQTPKHPQGNLRYSPVVTNLPTATSPMVLTGKSIGITSTSSHRRSIARGYASGLDLDASTHYATCCNAWS
eukprot:12893471-Prorocentrum_lima.AAC.1